jgi:hypothetical protein
MTESQKAFKTWFDVNYAAYYGQQAPIAVKTAWQVAEAYGRKQALEGLMHFISTEIVVSGCNVADEIVGVIKDIQDGK